MSGHIEADDVIIAIALGLGIAGAFSLAPWLGLLTACAVLLALGVLLGLRRRA